MRPLGERSTSQQIEVIDDPGSPHRRNRPMMGRLVMVCLAASGAHFLHNAVFLEQYPGPAWIPGPGVVVAAWAVLAAVLLIGYRWHRTGKSGPAAAAIVLYCLACFQVFGHYLYGSPTEFDALTNLLIVLEGATALVLLAYVSALAHRARGSAPSG